ncbi:hypothetical protein [uncultured Methylophaga sp.]|uniref:hypothetical protein n=1 Tax=uncultured Methylophaga sp. TaxID=285271 RepID=UPI002639CD6D|nr:hypothetical protein [uncultured Methylophaga sp.]
MTFTDARHTARMTLCQVAEYLDISLSTVKRYDKTDKAPKPVIECLRMVGGLFPDIAIKRNGFYGWSFGQGYLWSPGGERYTSGEILASRIDKALCDSLVVELDKAKKKNAANVESAEIIPFPVRRRRPREFA